MLMDGDNVGAVICPVQMSAFWGPDNGIDRGAKARHANKAAVNVLFYDGAARAIRYQSLRENEDGVFGHTK
jgi:prepilin-type processing-associated H-X9-DG protein